MTNRPINKDDYASITFDCYGTLIDWENGLLGYLQPLLQSYYVNTIDEFVLGLFSKLEPESQAAGGSYRQVLARVMEGFATRLGFTAADDLLDGLADSIQYWQPFPDSRDALMRLQRHFKLAIVSNVDDEIFFTSQRLLGIEFDEVVTSQQVGVYKPDPAMFHEALARLPGPVLHVAQSRYHDIVPASRLGLDTVWINRPSAGAAAPAEAEPTWTFNSMAEFTAAIGA